MNSREITTQISKAADFLNLKKWDYGASFSNDYSVQVDKGEAKQLKASQKQILTIRVWNQSNLVGITTTSDISESGIKKALKQFACLRAFLIPDSLISLVVVLPTRLD